ncbi:MAG: hypothetical protein JWN15_3879 [Firmicutes bacterium]|nr:hypothetical protein [Bacillota bacterium]
MILVVVEQMNLSFLLQHQGRFLQNARSATEALRLLRGSVSNLQGVILDDRIQGSRLVAGFVRTHAPGVPLVPWNLAQRHSPFRNVKDLPGEATRAVSGDRVRYVWDRSANIR